MKFAICASVDISLLHGACVAELLGVVLGVRDHKNIKFPMAIGSLRVEVFSRL